MNTTDAIRRKVQRIKRGTLFARDRFAGLGKPAAVNRALSRLVAEGLIMRPTRGVYVRPKRGKLIARVPPSVYNVVRFIVGRTGETIVKHGGGAANALHLSTQMPLRDVFYTSGRSRKIRVYRMTVKFVHTSCRPMLRLAGTVPGLAVSAMWFYGEKGVTRKVVRKIEETLAPEDFEILQKAKDLPDWMSRAVNARGARTTIHA